MFLLIVVVGLRISDGVIVEGVFIVVFDYLVICELGVWDY